MLTVKEFYELCVKHNAENSIMWLVEGYCGDGCVSCVSIDESRVEFDGDEVFIDPSLHLYREDV